jgi:hypothetical protein
MARLVLILFLSGAAGFSLRINSSPRQQLKSSTALKNDLRDEIERAAQQRAYHDKAKGGGVGETAAGAILGGLLGGPFGALVRVPRIIFIFTCIAHAAYVNVVS